MLFPFHFCVVSVFQVGFSPTLIFFLFQFCFHCFGILLALFYLLRSFLSYLYFISCRFHSTFIPFLLRFSFFIFDSSLSFIYVSFTFIFQLSCSFQCIALDEAFLSNFFLFSLFPFLLLFLYYFLFPAVNFMLIVLCHFIPLLFHF